MRVFRRRVWLWLVAGALTLLGSSLVGCAGLVAVGRGTYDFRLKNPVFAGRNVLSSFHRGHPCPVMAAALRNAASLPIEVPAGAVNSGWVRHRS